MTEKTKNRMLELLADRATLDIGESGLLELKSLEREFPDWKNDTSLEHAAASIGLIGVEIDEPMPKSLKSKILADASQFFGEEIASEPADDPAPVVVDETPAKGIFDSPVFEKPSFDFSRWLGWGLAAAACLALVTNIWLTRVDTQSQVAETKETPAAEKSLSEKRSALLASANDVVKTDWASPDKTKELGGEVVWSDEKQEGYMTFKGLAANDKAKEAYQLWIFRDEKLEPHPIDGGVFDVNEDGEVIIPIDAKLKVESPKIFAVTVEKPGGVVVSKREKIVALAKV
ncbi:MAG: anti-sigma factor [Pyrinomonadaceae bacterium]|nr:anti-sigma factor [Pyrinomonadaceae bacterium]